MNQDPVSGFGKKRAAPPKAEPRFTPSAFFSAAPDEYMPGKKRHAVILAILAFCFLLGGGYFFHVLLVFKTAILARTTAVLGPYPDSAVIFVTIPLFFSLLYLSVDYMRVKTGLHPFKTLPGFGVCAGILLLLLVLGHFPGMLIRHVQNNFAARQGYVGCMNQFDPQHLHIYALQSYVASYGCPTVNLPPAN